MREGFMRTILVVDDEPEIVNLVKNRLDVCDYKVISATDGEECVRKARTEKPDLIILDVMMPKMSGGDALRVLKANDTTKNIPIIFLTGVINDKNPMGEEARGINVGGEYYPAVGKPFEAENLLLEIKKHLS